MFTGIIEEVGVVKATQGGGLTISAGKVREGMMVGDSIAVNGVCLTVTGLGQGAFSVDVMPETIRCTNLGALHAGSRVNLERALGLGGRIGGHLVQGHVDATGRVISLLPEGDAILFRCAAPPQVMCYVVDKGFIAIDGVSLTVVNHDSASFEVSLVAYTRQNTVLGDRRPSSLVNLEVDIIAKYVEALGKGDRSGITVELLAEHGFLS